MTLSCPQACNRAARMYHGLQPAGAIGLFLHTKISLNYPMQASTQHPGALKTRNLPRMAAIQEAKVSDVMIVRLPSPPRLNVFRDWAGGFGTVLPSQRDHPGHDEGFFEVPFLQYLFIARTLQDRSISLSYHNLQKQVRFDLDRFLQKARQSAPKVIITSVSLPTLDDDLQIIQQLRSVTGTPVVLAGGVARLMHESILQNHQADFILIEHEERTAADAAEALLNGKQPAGVYRWDGSQVQATPANATMTDLDFVDHPAYDLLDLPYYESTYPFGVKYRYMTLLTSKGCPFPCQYCPYPFGFGKKVLYRSPEKVLGDIELLVNQYQVQFLLFRDQLLTLNREHCEKIFRGLLERKQNVIWQCETRYDLVDHDLLHLMAESGCKQINYGLESGDKKLFASIGKPGSKGLDYFAEIIKATKDAGIQCHTHLMIGLPDESRRSIRHTIRFLRKTHPDSVQVAIFMPYPGTPLGDQMAREEKLPSGGYRNYTGFKAVVPTRHLSIEQIDEMRLHIYNVWNRPFLRRAWNRLANWISPRTHQDGKPRGA